MSSEKELDIDERSTRLDRINIKLELLEEFTVEQFYLQST